MADAAIKIGHRHSPELPARLEHFRPAGLPAERPLITGQAVRKESLELLMLLEAFWERNVAKRSPRYKIKSRMISRPSVLHSKVRESA